MRLLKENLLLQFSVVSLVAMVIIAAVFVVLLSNIIKAHALEDAVEEAIATSSGRLLKAIKPADLEIPMTGERYNRFHEFVQESIVSGRTARVKLWAKDGTVIYSDDPELVGKRFPDNENLLVALRGEVAAEVKVPEGAENEQERFLGTLIEVYTPIIFPGTTEPQGAFEIYQYYQPTARLIANLQRQVLLSTVVGFSLLYGALVAIVWRGWRTIVRQRKERQQAEAEKEKMELQLRESQKMEALGRLAGGVAHDFNNLLTVIRVGSDMLLEALNRDDSKRQDIEEIIKATERAASLTRQLLTFSRRQVLEPKVLNVNSVISDMDKMLLRLIGEDVQLETILEPKLKSIKADRGSIEQVIMNLVVNARDAMPNGGKITIRTENTILDEKGSAGIAEAKPGEFVCVSITDTGIGMDKETREHIFEPFFTTKAKGEGTGLGLSTVYGIVKQIGGWINVYSEPGQGATFRIYLPTLSDSAEGKSELSKETASSPELRGNGERLLLVEDDELIRTATQRLLSETGYTVLSAGSAEEALAIFQREDGDFQLVICDVVLPDKSGVELADQLLALQPELRVILSSGYTDEKLRMSAVEEKGYPFLQKPYSTEKLLRSIKENIGNKGRDAR
ncbi:MAG TPA: response regulator [Dehalococcoidia bacterium]|nr:response regulator [Dehalococcoidia bacterium]